MSSDNGLENWMLHAYADGELDTHEQRAVERRLASDPAAKAEVEAWRSQKAALKASFDPVLGERIPPALNATLRRHGRSSWFRPTAIAAGLAFLTVGAAGGWLAASEWTTERNASFVDRAIVAYQVYAPEVRHPVEVAASERDHLAAWLSKRLGQPVMLPDLSAQGYTLLGGRLIAADDRPAAQLMYEDADKHRIAIFFAPNPGGQDQAFLVTAKGPVTACYWLTERLGFVITGETGRDKLMTLANAVYKQVDI